jgi:hypothetical protein
MHLIVRILIHASFWVLKFTLPACRPNIAAVTRITYKPEQASYYYYYYYYWTGPEAHPASYTVGTGSFPGVKRPGRGVDHPPHLGTEVEGLPGLL